ncbi:hypothetical protein ACN4EK_01100 [Pantanalinema rosaneae CENA516]|uniref:hypothetical protein n=1 Tax=Pantanalinema rosaneae TaxID=1620701 RepID=UPI003D6E6F74
MVAGKFQYVEEGNDAFLALFPHRFDYIWATHPLVGEKVEWQTERRHPLSDRAIQQGAYLYGVRFGAETAYCLFDIDLHSVYHPHHDPLAISRLVAALEPLGLVSYVVCTSSSSGGLHLYFPLPQAQSSWKLAIAVAALLENAGFDLRPGQLEIFPNPKPYRVDGTPSLFNAHRLPLQMGSYLLDQVFQPIWSTPASFVQAWQFAQTRNCIDRITLKQVIKQAKRKCYQISGKADKFINDLNAEIELGWTDFGQTNRLLGRITMREYIFHHVLFGGEPLVGKALVDVVVEVATSLPGYRDYCRHQHEIDHRVTEWVRCIENSRYFHYGDPSGKFKSNLKAVDLELAVQQSPTWNQEQSMGARERIRRAIADLLEQGNLPIGATARFHALTAFGIGGGTLYRHRDLWHPDHLLDPPVADQPSPAKTASSSSPVENPPHPPTSLMDSPVNCDQVALTGANPTSLFPGDGGNRASSLLPGDPISPRQPSGRNLEGDRLGTEISPATMQGIQFVRQVLEEIKQRQTTHQTATPLTDHQQQIKQQRSQAKRLAQMQEFLASGDPILMAEALAWAKLNPGLLDLRHQA